MALAALAASAPSNMKILGSIKTKYAGSFRGISSYTTMMFISNRDDVGDYSRLTPICISMLAS